MPREKSTASGFGELQAFRDPARISFPKGGWMSKKYFPVRYPLVKLEKCCSSQTTFAGCEIHKNLVVKERMRRIKTYLCLRRNSFINRERISNLQFLIFNQGSMSQFPTKPKCQTKSKVQNFIRLTSI